MGIINFANQLKEKVYPKKGTTDPNTPKSSVSQISDSQHLLELEIPEEQILRILKGLETFEVKQSYTSNKITLNYLAKRLHTNTNYLSKVINYYKKASFTNYINSLRIAYIITQLKQHRIYRKYTIRAIATEAGFNSPETFSKAFYKIKGIKPSCFLKDLESLP